MKKKKKQIAIIGASKTICTKKAYDQARELGKELAKRNCIVLTGGGLGVMEAALKGAKEAGGLTMAIIPWVNMKKVNDYADVVVATGIGWSRNSINLSSCDGAIIVGGGAGTLNEASYAYMLSKPLVALATSGGTAKKLAGTYLDVRKTERIFSATTPLEATNKILGLITKKEKEKKFSEFDQDLVDSEEQQDWKVIVNKKKKELEK
jgi:uncharacterized protein (TIGR00725 family)